MSEFEQTLEIQIGADHCSTATARTFLKLATPRDQWDLLPNQIEIGREVFVIAGDPLELWSPPESNLEFLRRYFNEAGFVEGEPSGLTAVAGHLNLNHAVAVLYQDRLPDEDHPAGYPDDGDQGHYGFILSIRGRLVHLADPSRLVPGNQRWFDANGVVLAEPFAGQPGYQPEARSIYWMKLADFLPNWWDKRVPPSQEKYFKPFLWVDLASRR